MQEEIKELGNAMENLLKVRNLKLKTDIAEKQARAKVIDARRALCDKSQDLLSDFELDVNVAESNRKILEANKN